jgi:hypothetical protein
LVTVTVLVTFQENVVVPFDPAVSVAVTVTEHEQAAVGVPEMVPVDAPMVRPAGRPVADQVNVWPDWESVARTVTLVAALPDVEVCEETELTVTLLLTVQAKVVVPYAPVLSEALTVTEHEHGAVGVPVIDPVEELMARPAGRPVADQVKVWPDWESVAEFVTVLMAVPVVPVWADLAVTVTLLDTVQLKLADPA